MNLTSQWLSDHGYGMYADTPSVVIGMDAHKAYSSLDIVVSRYFMWYIYNKSDIVQSFCRPRYASGPFVCPSVS